MKLVAGKIQCWDRMICVKDLVRLTIAGTICAAVPREYRMLADSHYRNRHIALTSVPDDYNSFAL